MPSNEVTVCADSGTDSEDTARNNKKSAHVLDLVTRLALSAPAALRPSGGLGEKRRAA